MAWVSRYRNHDHTHARHQAGTTEDPTPRTAPSTSQTLGEYFPLKQRCFDFRVGRRSWDQERGAGAEKPGLLLGLAPACPSQAAFKTQNNTAPAGRSLHPRDGQAPPGCVFTAVCLSLPSCGVQRDLGFESSSAAHEHRNLLG